MVRIYATYIEEVDLQNDFEKKSLIIKNYILKDPFLSFCSCSFKLLSVPYLPFLRLTMNLLLAFFLERVL